MAGSPEPESYPTPTILPLGDSAILVRFGTTLTDSANRAAIALSDTLRDAPIAGVAEVMPNLVSVLLRYDPFHADPSVIAGELRLRLGKPTRAMSEAKHWHVPVTFDGPDLSEVAEALNLTVGDFIAQHNKSPIRVLATGFAPGFVYCGLHPQALVLPRRPTVRPSVPAGSVLFAAGQTAITSTEMPTGWHVIGHTSFSNFDTDRDPPTRLSAGDRVVFEVAT